MPLTPETAGLIGQGISGVSSIVGGLLGTGGSSNYQKQVGLMDYANWYNEPINQKNRLIKAGLNPSLMYQTMPQNVSETPSAQMNNYKAENMLAMGNNIGQMLQNMINASVQNDAIRADTALKEQEYRNREAMNPLTQEGTGLDNKKKGLDIVQTELSNDMKKMEQKYLEEYLQSRNQGQHSSNENVIQGTLKIKQEIANLETLGQQMLKSLSYMDINQKMAVDKTLAEIENLGSSTSRNKVATLLDKLESQLRTKYGLSYHDEVKTREAIKAIKNSYMQFNSKRNVYPSKVTWQPMSMQEYIRNLRSKIKKVN